MADSLTDLGSPIEDWILVLNILQGMNQCFEHVGSIIRCYSPFPNFLKVRDDLLLEEIHMDSIGPSAAPTTLYTNTVPRQLGHHPPRHLACPAVETVATVATGTRTTSRTTMVVMAVATMAVAAIIALLARPPPPLPLTAEPACHG
jgi:hypothetical protein